VALTAAVWERWVADDALDKPVLVPGMGPSFLHWAAASRTPWVCETVRNLSEVCGLATADNLPERRPRIITDHDAGNLRSRRMEDEIRLTICPHR
jgi:hypothetical protein